MQAPPVPQLLMQVPQLAPSVIRSTQWPPHAVVPVGHVQMPAMHIVPAAHVVPHVPQFVPSVIGSTQ